MYICIWIHGRTWRSSTSAEFNSCIFKGTVHAHKFVYWITVHIPPISLSTLIAWVGRVGARQIRTFAAWTVGCRWPPEHSFPHATAAAAATALMQQREDRNFLFFGLLCCEQSARKRSPLFIAREHHQIMTNAFRTTLAFLRRSYPRKNRQEIRNCEADQQLRRHFLTHARSQSGLTWPFWISALFMKV